MKTELTVEQSQRLIELGVAASKASATRYVVSTTETYCGYSREIVVIDGYINDYISQEPIFTLSDILAMLPKEIEDEDYAMWYQLHAGADTCGYSANYCHFAHTTEYVCAIDETLLEGFSAPELIDALYELLIWCINEKHIEL